MDSYVRGLVRQYDKNGDMMLQADEQKSLSGRAAGADLDKDGVITVDELVTTLSGSGPTATAAGTGSSPAATRADDSGDRDRSERGALGERRRGRDRDGSNEEQSGRSRGAAATRVYTALGTATGAESGSEKRRTYRFTPAAERMPTEVAATFKSRDVDGDGQVSMSEFSRSWSQRTVDDFRRYDLNNDGIITPQEAIKSKWR
jgi:Ca2+-binding EF-hand superfamily protein